MRGIVSEIMTKPALMVEPTNSLLFAVRLMEDHGVECVVVVEDRKVVGIVTHHDVVHKVVLPGLDPKEICVKDVMSSPVITCKANMPIFEALQLMVKHKIRRIPVVDSENTLLGIVTDYDISEYLHELLRSRPRI